ncbi:oxygenase MpaB family protein [Homoserinimonas sp. OAct 916]|uniref:oxygenase MpaB family protein n=1 Tax=Homoserinimonas sp. OAct 916 TaxID=2211450 RepID=UPI001E5739DD|nr:oxygenase MpaB family protein [Homoserinimonas sp. OAct 916]
MTGNRTLSLTDIGAEGILLAGGARAILLQVANPHVGQGVAGHSDFSSRPLDRLKATMTYVYAVTYGTDDQRAEVVRRVNRAHGPVHGSPTPVAGPAGSEPVGYNAFDPQLQLWVAATLYETAVSVYQRVFGSLDAESADRIYQDYAVLGTSLQVPAGSWPANRMEFTTYWNGQLDSLLIGAAARHVARDLFHPTGAPWWLRALLPSLRFVTAGLLPPGVRADYGFRWDARRQRRFDRAVRIIATIYPPLPRRLRFRLRDRCLAALDRSLHAR